MANDEFRGAVLVAAPSAPGSPATKQYVDDGDATRVPTTRQVLAGTGLTGGGDLSADRTLTVAYGSSAATAVQGNDTRVTADQVAGTASIRTLGTGAQQAAAGTAPAAAVTAHEAATDPHTQYLTNARGDARYQPLDTQLSALAGVAGGVDALPYFTSTSAASQTTLSSFMRTVLDDADAATARTTLGAAATTDLASYVPTTRSVLAGTGLTGGGALSADRTLTVAYGSAAGTAVQGNDVRVTADQAVGTASIRTLGTGALQAAAGNDSRFTDSRTPSGTAGGDLTGTYPNPTIAAALKDPVAATAGLRTLGTGAAQAAAGNDSRLSDARTPTGTAGGDLTGTYPNPTLRATLVDPVAATAGLRTLGTGAQQAAAGNDSRLSDARTPVAHVHSGADITTGTVGYARLPVGTAVSTIAAGDDARIVGAVQTTRSIIAGTGLTGGGTLAADRTLTVAYGSTAGTAAQGNDARLSDARTPTAHAASHASGGGDPITPAAIGAAAAVHVHSGADITTGTVGYARLPVGTAVSTIAAGDDARIVGAVQTTRQVIAGTGLTGGGTLAADRTLTVAYGSTAGTAAQGNDSRLSDARTPLAHAASHAKGQADVLTPLAIGAVMSAVPTAIKTAAYTAAVGEMVLVDATAGPITITLPVISAGGDRVAVKKLDSSTNVVTVAAGTGNTIGSAGASSVPIRLQDQAVSYQASGTNWVIPHSHLGLPSLDARFVAQSVATAKGDMLAATGAGAFARLGVGTDGYALVADSTQALGVKWAAVAGGGGSPTGAAGGSLAGTYPNPTIAAGVITGTEIAAAIKDPAAATAGLRTLGTGAAQAAAGNDARLSDQRAWSLYTAGGETSGYVPTWNGTKYVAAAPTGGGGGLANLTTFGIYNVKSYGATGDGTTDDTAAIQAALNATPAGAICWVPPGVYRTSAALVVPPQVTLEGTHGVSLTYGTGPANPCVIKPLAAGSWTGVAAVIRFLNKTAGSYATDSLGQRVRRLTIDGSANATAAMVGIQLYGYVRETICDQVTVRNMVSDGFATTSYSPYTGDTAAPQSCRFLDCYADNCGGAGFVISGPDCVLVNCNAQGAGYVGYLIQYAPNTQLIGCRAEWAGNHNYYITGSYGTGQGAGAVLMSGCSSDRANYNGILIDSTGSAAHNISGFSARRDGRNGGTGAGNYAGIQINGATNPVAIDGLTVYPGVNDDGSGTNSPQHGVRVTGSTHVSVDSGYIHAATTAVTDNGGNAYFAVAPAVGRAVGTTAAPTRTVPTAVALTNDPRFFSVARPGDDLNAKIAALTPGQTLLITGRHVVTDALVAVSGSSTLPITIRGDGTAVIEHSGGRTGTGYALTITGAYLHFADFTAQEAAKAIVVQGSTAHDITFERVVGRATKNEAWKFRQGANLIHLWDCHAEDTGLGASFGEGFYVGEAASNWLPTANVTPDTTSYIRFERCSTRRTRNDGFDFKEGAHHIVVKDCVVEKPTATIADAQGDSGYYNRADTVQYINCHARNVPGDGFKPYDVVVNAITYGRGVEIWGGLVEGAGGAGVASQSDDLKVYSNFAIAGTVTGGRTNVVGGGWTSAYDPTTLTELTWTSPALLWRVELQPHAASHGTGGQDQITPAMIGAASTIHVHSGADITSGTVAYGRLPVGTAASTVAAGDDTRLTNARTPTAHAASHAPGGSDDLSGSYEPLTHKAAASGYASLDAGTKVPIVQLPTGGANGLAQLDSSGILPTANQYGASTTTYGILMLAGDLGGTAAAPKIIGNTMRAVTGATTLTDADGIVVVTPSGATATATLPTPVGRTGKRFVVKKAYGATAFAVSIATAAGTIDGAATEVIMVAGGYREVISDGANWHIIGGTVIPVIYTPTAPTNGATVTPDATMASVFRYTPAVAGWILGNPTNGVDGLQINIEITPSVSFTLTITGPALTTGITSPVAVASGKKCFVGLRYSGSTWYVIALTTQS